MAQKQFLFWSLASCTEGLNRNWNNSFISCSHPPVLSCATVASRMGKASFVDWTWHALSDCTQGMNTLTQFTATAVTYYFKKQLTKPEEILLLPVYHIWKVTSTCQQQRLTFTRLETHTCKGCWASACQSFISFGTRGLKYSLRLWGGDLLWQSWVRRWSLQKPSLQFWS